jgi:polar amino acid transport system substrate-binding protein
MKFRHVASAIAVLLPGSLLLAGIPSTASGAASAPLFKDLPAAIQKSKVINVGTSVAYPPYDYNTASNPKVIGFEPDLRTALGKLLGVKFVNQVVTFDELVPGIQADRFTIAMDGVSDTKAREAVVDFVDYVQPAAVMLVLSSNAKSVTNVQSLCGKTIGASTGTTAATQATDIEQVCTSAGKPADQPKLFPNVADVQLALKSGRVFTQLEDTATGGYDALTSKGQIKSIPITGSITKEGDFAPGLEGVVVAKGQTQLEKALQTAFNTLIGNGTYGKILKKWDIPGLAVKKATIDTPSS